MKNLIKIFMPIFILLSLKVVAQVPTDITKQGSLNNITISDSSFYTHHEYQHTDAQDFSLDFKNVGKFFESPSNSFSSKGDFLLQFRIPIPKNKFGKDSLNFQYSANSFVKGNFGIGWKLKIPSLRKLSSKKYLWIINSSSKKMLLRPKLFQTQEEIDLLNSMTKKFQRALKFGTPFNKSNLLPLESISKDGKNFHLHYKDDSDEYLISFLHDGSYLIFKNKKILVEGQDENFYFKYRWRKNKLLSISYRELFKIHFNYNNFEVVDKIIFVDDINSQSYSLVYHKNEYLENVYSNDKIKVFNLNVSYKNLKFQKETLGNSPFICGAKISPSDSYYNVDINGDGIIDVVKISLTKATDQINVLKDQLDRHMIEIKRHKAYYEKYKEYAGHGPADEGLANAKSNYNFHANEYNQILEKSIKKIKKVELYKAEVCYKDSRGFNEDPALNFISTGSYSNSKSNNLDYSQLAPKFADFNNDGLVDFLGCSIDKSLIPTVKEGLHFYGRGYNYSLRPQSLISAILKEKSISRTFDKFDDDYFDQNKGYFQLEKEGKITFPTRAEISFQGVALSESQTIFPKIKCNQDSIVFDYNLDSYPDILTGKTIYINNGDLSFSPKVLTDSEFKDLFKVDFHSFETKDNVKIYPFGKKIYVTKKNRFSLEKEVIAKIHSSINQKALKSIEYNGASSIGDPLKLQKVISHADECNFKNDSIICHENKNLNIKEYNFFNETKASTIFKHYYGSRFSISSTLEKDNTTLSPPTVNFDDDILNLRDFFYYSLLDHNSSTTRTVNHEPLNSKNELFYKIDSNLHLSGSKQYTNNLETTHRYGYNKHQILSDVLIEKTQGGISQFKRKTFSRHIYNLEKLKLLPYSFFVETEDNPNVMAQTHGYIYDTNGCLKSKIRSRGGTFANFECNTNGQIIKTTNKLGLVTEFIYDSKNEYITKKITYDENDIHTEEILKSGYVKPIIIKKDPFGITTEYSFFTNGLLKKKETYNKSNTSVQSSEISFESKECSSEINSNLFPIVNSSNSLNDVYLYDRNFNLIATGSCNKSTGSLNYKTFNKYGLDSIEKHNLLDGTFSKYINHQNGNYEIDQFPINTYSVIGSSTRKEYRNMSMTHSYNFFNGAIKGISANQNAYEITHDLYGSISSLNSIFSFSDDFKYTSQFTSSNNSIGKHKKVQFNGYELKSFEEIDYKTKTIDLNGESKLQLTNSSKLKSSSSSNQYMIDTKLSYDKTGLISNISFSYKNNNFLSFNFEYDALNRLSKTTYPLHGNQKFQYSSKNLNQIKKWTIYDQEISYEREYKDSYKSLNPINSISPFISNIKTEQDINKINFQTTITYPLQLGHLSQVVTKENGKTLSKYVGKTAFDNSLQYKDLFEMNLILDRNTGLYEPSSEFNILDSPNQRFFKVTARRKKKPSFNRDFEGNITSINDLDFFYSNGKLTNIVSKSGKNLSSMFYNFKGEIFATCNKDYTPSDIEQCFYRLSNTEFLNLGHYVKYLYYNETLLGVLVKKLNETKIHFFPAVSDHLGSLLELYNDKGERLFSRRYSFLGEIEEHINSNNNDTRLLSKIINLGFASNFILPFNESSSVLYQSLTRVYSPIAQTWLSLDQMALKNIQTLVKSPHALDLLTYANDKPHNLIDPTGYTARAMIIGTAGGALIGGIAGGIAAYGTDTGVFNGVLAGTITGAAIGLGSSLSAGMVSAGVSATVAKGAVGGIFGFTGNMLGQIAAYMDVDLSQSFVAGAGGFATTTLSASLGHGLSGASALVRDAAVNMAYLPADVGFSLGVFQLGSTQIDNDFKHNLPTEKPGSYWNRNQFNMEPATL